MSAAIDAIKAACADLVTWARDYTTDGVPASGDNEPSKPVFRTNIAAMSAGFTELDSLIAALGSGLLNNRGTWTPAVSSGSTGYPTTGGSGSAGAIKANDAFFAAADGYIRTTAILAGDMVFAKVDTPGQTAANWYVIPAGLDAPTLAAVADLVALKPYTVYNYPWYNLATNPNLDPSGPAQAYNFPTTHISTPPTSTTMQALDIYSAYKVGVDAGLGFFTAERGILDASSANAEMFFSCYQWSEDGVHDVAPRVNIYRGATLQHALTMDDYIDIDGNNRLYWLSCQLGNYTDYTLVAVGANSSGGSVALELGGIQIMMSPDTVLDLTNTPRNDWYGRYQNGRVQMGVYLDQYGVKNLVGKTIVWLGDSIVQSHNLPTLFAAATGATVINAGFSSHALAQIAGATSGGLTDCKNKMSGSALSASIASGDWSVPIAAASTLYGIDSDQDHRATVAALAALDWSTVDYIWASYLTNDLTNNRTLGVATSSSVNDIYGAINTFFDNIQGAYPAVQIVLGAPMYRNDGTFGDSNTTANGVGVTMAQIQAALRAQGLIYGAPVWEPQTVCGFNKHNYGIGSDNAADGLHPDAPAQAIIIQKQTAWARATL